MFEKGRAVVYATQGVCVIEGIELLSFGKEKREYYVLKPVYDANSTIYAPTDNEAVTSKMRPVLTKDEIDGLIASLADSEQIWIENDEDRRSLCDSVIASGDRRAILEITGMLYRRQRELKAQKKNFHQADEKYLREAERIIRDEFAYVINISHDEVPAYIAERTGDE